MKNNKLSKRNYGAILGEGVFYITGLAYIDINSVIPVFVESYTGNIRIVGLASFFSLCMYYFGQIVIGLINHRIKDIPKYLKTISFSTRLLVFILVPVIISNMGPMSKVWITIIIVMIIRASDGFYLLPLYNLIHKTLENDIRGKALGGQQLLGGVGSIIAGLSIRLIIGSASIEQSSKYAIIFAICGVFFAISSFYVLRFRDFESKNKISNWNYRKTILGISTALKNDRYLRKLLTLLITNSFSIVFVPFMIIAFRKAYDLDDKMISNLIYLKIFGSIIGGFLHYKISPKHGSKKTIVIAQIIKIVALFFAVLTFTVFSSNYWITGVLAVVLTGMYFSMDITSLVSYRLEISEQNKVHIYTMICCIVSFPLAFLTYIAASSVEIIGYCNLFVICLILAFLPLINAIRLKNRRL